MILHFEVTGESRKAMVNAIEKELGVKAKYLGAPSFAYQIGAYKVGKNGELEFSDLEDIDEVSPIIDVCVTVTGVNPIEWDGTEEEPKTEERLTVSIPLDKVDVGNLINLLEAKGELIQKALGIESVYITEQDETVSFPWFSELPDADHAKAYTKFISALCEMSARQKRITAKAKENENEKYAFRCFLLRLGFIGDEYKVDRKILLSKLDGSSAFKSGAKKEGRRAVMFFPPSHIVERIKADYPDGTRVALVHMDDPYAAMPEGTKGTVIGVDDTGTIHVNWDNGHCLGIVYGEDSCRKIK